MHKVERSRLLINDHVDFDEVGSCLNFHTWCLVEEA